jgi:hypothetical protein
MKKFIIDMISLVVALSVAYIVETIFMMIFINRFEPYNVILLAGFNAGASYLAVFISLNEYLNEQQDQPPKK